MYIIRFLEHVIKNYYRDVIALSLCMITYIQLVLIHRVKISGAVSISKLKLRLDCYKTQDMRI